MLEDQAGRGACFPNLVVARLVSSSTELTRIRDEERSPIAADLKRAMKEKEEPADVSEAHQQVPVHPLDWRFLGSQIAKVSTVHVTSASYYWNRVGAAIGRISQYVVGSSAATWHMLVADDCHLKAGGEEYRFALMTFFIVCSIVGVPLSWNKTSGGETVTWVGFELLRRTRQLGISQKRADWFRRWTT